MDKGLINLSRLATPAEPAAGSRIGEARDALASWSRRSSELPWHRRAERKEARAMTAKWRAQLIGAHLERWRFGRVEGVLTPLLDTRGRSGGGHVRWLAWNSMRRTAIGRRLLLAAACAAVAGAASLTLVVVFAAHLAGI